MNSKVKNKESLNSSTFSLKNKLARVLWAITYLILFRFSPNAMFGWRRIILRIFGASIAKGALVYSSVKIWLPSNLSMLSGSTLGPRVNVYNQGLVTIGENVIISQDVTLCASTHNYNDPVHPLILAPISVANDTWVCAEAFVGPGVRLASGTVIGARGVVSRNTDDWCVYAGNPAVKVNERERF